MYDDASVIHRNTRSWPLVTDRRSNDGLERPSSRHVCRFLRNSIEKEEERKKEGMTNREDFIERQRDREIDLCVGICWLMGVREV